MKIRPGLWFGIAGAFMLGLVATTAYAGFATPPLNALNASVPAFGIERVHGTDRHTACKSHGSGSCHAHTTAPSAPQLNATWPCNPKACTQAGPTVPKTTIKQKRLPTRNKPEVREGEQLDVALWPLRRGTACQLTLLARPHSLQGTSSGREYGHEKYSASTFNPNAIHNCSPRPRPLRL